MLFSYPHWHQNKKLVLGSNQITVCNCICLLNREIMWKQFVRVYLVTKSYYRISDCIECCVRERLRTSVDTQYVPIYKLSNRINMGNWVNATNCLIMEFHVCRRENIWSGSGNSLKPKIRHYRINYDYGCVILVFYLSI